MMTTILSMIFAIAVAAAKLGVLIWIFVRTRRPAALFYGLYLLLMDPVGNAMGDAIAEAYRPTAEPEAWARRMWMLSQASALIETSLFIWLLWPLLRQINSKNVSS